MGKLPYQRYHDKDKKKGSLSLSLMYQRILFLSGIPCWFPELQSKEKRSCTLKKSASLTFAGVRSSFWSTRVPEEAFLTVLAVTALCAVATVVTHASTASPRSQPQSTTEVTAFGVAVTLALCV